MAFAWVEKQFSIDVVIASGIRELKNKQELKIEKRILINIF
jgi:hypothetical protein